MPEISDELLHDVASNVARRIASGSIANVPRAGRSVMLALSADGPILDREFTRLAESGDTILAVCDCAEGVSPALASAMVRLPRLQSPTSTSQLEVERLISETDRVVAPSMSLSLASRVASLQSDTPAARVILLAALRGVRVDATLNETEFVLSDQAPSGARRAVESVVERLRALGITVDVHRSAPAARAAAASFSLAAHPSVDRFAEREPLLDFVDSLASQPCSIEPGQPCVDCGVCEMRGF